MKPKIYKHKMGAAGHEKKIDICQTTQEKETWKKVQDSRSEETPEKSPKAPQIEEEIVTDLLIIFRFLTTVS